MLANSYILEKDWITKSGFRAACLLVRNKSHRCGYVEIPSDHFLYEIPYNQPHPLLKEKWEQKEKKERGKRSVLLVLIYDPENITPEIYFDVHGSLTYSDNLKGYPIDGESNWWIGFDCAHEGDASCSSIDGIHRTLSYVEKECEALAQQIKDLENDS